MSQPDSSWTDWYERHGRALVLLARQWCASHADAEDAVHDAFLKFWPKRNRVDDPTAYLYRCTKNAALNRQRGDKRRRKREVTAASEAIKFVLPITPTFEDCDESQALTEALGGLPEDQRQVVVMKIWGGLTFAQVAEACEVSPNTAASRYQYRRLALPIRSQRTTQVHDAGGQRWLKKQPRKHDLWKANLLK